MLPSAYSEYFRRDTASATYGRHVGKAQVPPPHTSQPFFNTETSASIINAQLSDKILFDRLLRCLGDALPMTMDQVAGNIRRTRGRRGQAPGLETFGPLTRLGKMVFGAVRLAKRGVWEMESRRRLTAVGCVLASGNSAHV